MTGPILRAQNLCKTYWIKQGFFSKSLPLHALQGVSFDLYPGTTLAVVGESGCGKSTLAKILTGMEPSTEGELQILGQHVRKQAKMQNLIQMVFQNPHASLNPRKRIQQILAEPLEINTPLDRNQRIERVTNMLKQVGLRPEHARRFPHMFSGGQKQRIAIARALMLNPEIVVADEPVSALDVSIQAQILNLLLDLQAKLSLAYIFISHDLSVVNHVAHQVMVMYLGKIVEYGSKSDIFQNPRHPYTKALMSSTPHINKGQRQQKLMVKGELPSPLSPPSGCAFHTRCPMATERCKKERPLLRDVMNRQVACHYAESDGISQLSEQ